MMRVQLVFTTDGDHEAEWAAAGINHHWLPPGVLAVECYDAPPAPEWAGRWDVAFVGSAPGPDGRGTYHPEWAHRAEMVEHLRDWYGERFVHVGNGGDMANNLDRPNLRGDDLNRFYASVAITVGDSCLVSEDGSYWSDRVPETWGRGGFLIHPYVRKLSEMFLDELPGWHLGDWALLHSAIDRALSLPDAREKTRWRIAAEVRARHTYTNRVQTILDTIGLA